MRLLLETLTPVHIGSGEIIEPYEYVIIEKFHRINLGKFILSLDIKDRENFLKISSTDMVATRNFIKEKANISDVTEYSIRTDHEIRNIYTNKINDPNNQLSVQTFIKTNNRPFIPGSSLKGSIRTALLFSMAHKPINDVWEIEKNVFEFKNAQNDPFRTLKISDSSFINYDNMLICNVKTYTKKDRFDVSGYNTMIEAIDSDSTGESIKIYHDIIIDDILKKQNRFINIDIDNIMSSCNEFYGSVIANEIKFYGSSNTSYAYDRYVELEKTLYSIEKEKSFILRLGWGSGYDSVTINLAREVKSFKKSRRLIHEEIPLGWVKAKILEN